MQKGFLVVAIFLLPSLALATGFAKGSLFLSQDSVTQGDTVLVHAVINNDQSTSFSGSVVFTDGSTSMGSVPVSLDAGDSSVASISWQPTAGSHTINATLESTGGAVVENESATFTILPPPQPASDSSSSANSAAVESSQSIQNSIGSVSPQVESAVAPAFTFVDGVRQSAADTLSGQIASVQPKVTGIPLPGAVLGAQTNTPSTTVPSQSNWFWSIFYTIYFYLLTILLFIVNSAAIFYPVVALIFLYILWVMFRRFRRA